MKLLNVLFLNKVIIPHGYHCQDTKVSEFSTSKQPDWDHPHGYHYQNDGKKEIPLMNKLLVVETEWGCRNTFIETTIHGKAPIW